MAAVGPKNERLDPENGDQQKDFGILIPTGKLVDVEFLECQLVGFEIHIFDYSEKLFIPFKDIEEKKILDPQKVFVFHQETIEEFISLLKRLKKQKEKKSGIDGKVAENVLNDKDPQSHIKEDWNQFCRALEWIDRFQKLEEHHKAEILNREKTPFEKFLQKIPEIHTLKELEKKPNLEISNFSSDEISILVEPLATVCKDLVKELKELKRIEDNEIAEQELQEIIRQIQKDELEKSAQKPVQKDHRAFFLWAIAFVIVAILLGMRLTYIDQSPKREWYHLKDISTRIENSTNCAVLIKSVKILGCDNIIGENIKLEIEIRKLPAFDYIRKNFRRVLLELAPNELQTIPPRKIENDYFHQFKILDLTDWVEDTKTISVDVNVRKGSTIMEFPGAIKFLLLGESKREKDKNGVPLLKGIDIMDPIWNLHLHYFLGYFFNFEAGFGLKDIFLLILGGIGSGKTVLVNSIFTLFSDSMTIVGGASATSFHNTKQLHLYNMDKSHFLAKSNKTVNINIYDTMGWAGERFKTLEELAPFVYGKVPLDKILTDNKVRNELLKKYAVKFGELSTMPTKITRRTFERMAHGLIIVQESDGVEHVKDRWSTIQDLGMKPIIVITEAKKRKNQFDPLVIEKHEQEFADKLGITRSQVIFIGANLDNKNNEKSFAIDFGIYRLLQLVLHTVKTNVPEFAKIVTKMNSNEEKCMEIQEQVLFSFQQNLVDKKSEFEISTKEGGVKEIVDLKRSKFEVQLSLLKEKSLSDFKERSRIACGDGEFMKTLLEEAVEEINFSILIAMLGDA